MRSRRLAVLFALGLGIALGAAGTGRVLFDRTGRGALASLRSRLGMGSESAPARRSAFGYDGTEEARSLTPAWDGVVSPTQPGWRVRPGFDVEQVAGGLVRPVSVVLADSADPAHDAPKLYVLELGGAVRLVTRSGELETYAERAVEFPAEEARRYALSDDMGAVGLATIPDSEDLIVTGIYLDEASGLVSNRVLRLVSEPGGRRLARREVILDLEEFTTPTHQIQGARVGTDGKLWVSVGDGHAPRLALRLDRFGGKILRMELDGSPCTDNPYFEATQPEARSGFVWARGLRNAFGFDFDPRTGALYAADNGTDTDRLLRVERGGAYGWDGSAASFRTNATFVWAPPRPNTSPAGMCFPEGDPLRTGADRMYVALFTGSERGIVEVRVDADSGLLGGAPLPIVRPAEGGPRTVLGLAEGPGGLLFTDFDGTPDEPTGAVWRLVRSAATEGLVASGSSATGIEHGRQVFARDCSACHVVGGLGGGGKEGPDLTRIGTDLGRRLHSPAYAARLDRLLDSEEGFLRAQRPALEAVRDAGDTRVEVWLREHLREPRFDDKFARMPAFDLSPVDLDGVVAYLLSLESD